jgi:hypothetical protein
MFKEILSLFYDGLVLNMFFKICPFARSGSRYCFGFRGTGESESKTHRLEFLSSQVGNPTCECNIIL